MGFIVSLLASVLLVGCATLPDVHPWLAPTSQKPAMVGARGPLSAAQTAAVLKRLQSRGNDSDLLTKHIAIEEEVAGRPLTIGNAVRLLNDGPASYRAMFEAIERARDHIHVEFYIIESDEVGQRLSEALLRKSAQGVAVNLMYDSVGSSEADPEYFKRLREGGVQVLEYNPVNPLRARGAWRINNRNHRKLVIVDGAVAFTGGINISNVYASSSRGSSGSRGSGGLGSSGGSRDSRKAGWRDTNVRIEGPAVEQLQRLFLDTWAKQNGPALAQRSWFPKTAPKGDHPVRVVASGPQDEVPSIYVALLTAMASADKSIHITMAYFVPDPQTLEALTSAAKRGVDVKLVLPSYTDFWAVFHAARSHYSELMRAGVKIYERQEALLHSKTIVIDGVWSTVGSANLDWRSYLHNEELNVVVLGVDFGTQMERMFESDLAQSAPIEPQAWARRPISVRMKELAARVWEYWL
jgi:cardiolipin synthase A/B